MTDTRESAAPLAGSDGAPTTGQSDEGLGGEARVPKGGRRDRIRSKPGVRHAYRLGIFLLGLLFILAGIALATLPGPLTIPPVLLGLWIWSTEFKFAERFFDKFKKKGHEAWAHAKRRPISSTIVTVGGLVGAAAAIWAVTYFGLIDKAKQAIF